MGPSRHLVRRGDAAIRYAIGCDLGRVYGAQELRELVTDLGRGFVLNPMPHVVEFEIPHEAGKAGANFFYGRIESLQAIRLPRNVKGRLGDLRAFPRAGQIEIRVAHNVAEFQRTGFHGGLNYYRAAEPMMAVAREPGDKDFAQDPWGSIACR
jgi:hypothetical protein